MKLHRYLLLVAFLQMCMLHTNAHAVAVAVIDSGTGKVTGFTNVDLLGQVYSVEFKDGLLDDIFTGVLDFTNEDDAHAAADALLDVYTNDAPPIYTNDPSQTFGITDLLIGIINTPYTLAGEAYAFANNASPGPGPGLPPADATFINDIVEDTSTDPFNVYADWTLSPAPVPVPAAIWFMGSGLLGLMGFSRRRKAAKAVAA